MGLQGVWSLGVFRVLGAYRISGSGVFSGLGGSEIRGLRFTKPETLSPKRFRSLGGLRPSGSRQQRAKERIASTPLLWLRGRSIPERFRLIVLGFRGMSVCVCVCVCVCWVIVAVAVSWWFGVRGLGEFDTKPQTLQACAFRPQARSDHVSSC